MHVANESLKTRRIGTHLKAVPAVSPEQSSFLKKNWMPVEKIAEGRRRLFLKEYFLMCGKLSGGALFLIFFFCRPSPLMKTDYGPDFLKGY